MADKKVTVTIEAIDKASSTIKNVSSQLNSLGKLSGLSGLSTTIKDVGSQLNSLGKLSGLNGLSATIKDVGSQLSALGKLSGLSGLSKAGSVINSMGNAMSSIKGKAGLAVAGITMVVSGFNKLYSASKQNFISGISKIGSVCQAITNKVISLGKSFLGLVGQVSNSDLSFGGLIKTSLSYHQTLERISIKSQKVGESTAQHEANMKQLDSTMRILTADTIYSMSEIASAAEYMVQNGRSATQVMNELSGVTSLATLGNMKLSNAADIVTGTMNMFNKQTLTAQQVANVFATAANNSGANVENLAKALENCGPQANLLGISLQETVGTLALMGNNMIRGGKAGTSLKNTLQRMANPTKGAKEAIKQYHLETAQAMINSGRLKDGLIEMQRQFRKQKVSGKELVTATKKIVGSYGYAGLSAVIGTTTDKIKVMYKAMELGLVSTDNLTEGMDSLMDTTRGQLMRFSANVELAFDSLLTNSESSIAGVMNVLNDFMANLNSGMSLEEALKKLENQCSKLPQILSNAISKGIAGIDNFINGGAFDSILNIGTKIIDGITGGINKAYNNGSLTSAISGLIGKVADWITNNLPKIETAAKQIIDAIKIGIETNKTKIASAMNAICSFIKTWVVGSAELEAAMGQFARIMIDSFISQTWQVAATKAGELWDALMSMLNPSEMPDFSKDWTGILQWIDKLFGGGTEKAGQNGEKTGQSYGEGVQRGVNRTPLKLNPENFRQSYNEYGNHGLTGGQNFGVSTAKGIESTKAEIITKGSEVGTGTAQAIEDGLNSMNTDQLQALKTAIDEVGKTTKSTADSMKSSFTTIIDSARTSFIGFANIVKNQMLNVGNTIRFQMQNARSSLTTSFISMANVARVQMLSVSNTIRKQAISWSNIMRNQCQNARNALTSSFISMRKVANTQMTLISNTIRAQAINWSNIIRNQAQNARNALTRSFMSMAAVARTQMSKVLSVVQSYMSQITAACNRTLTLKVNVSKTETTTKKVVIENGPMSLSMPQTSSLSASSYSGTRGVANSIGLGTLAGAMSSVAGSERAISIEVPLVLEGREIARASAIYTREELARLEKRNNRKRGE